MLTDNDRKAMERIAAQAERLANEVRRLRGDVARLHSRIVPFDDEVKISGVPSEDWTPGARRETWRLVDSLNLLADSRREVIDAEMHLNAIRGRMDEIAADAMLRDEMKPYIIPPPRRGLAKDRP